MRTFELNGKHYTIREASGHEDIRMTSNGLEVYCFDKDNKLYCFKKSYIRDRFGLQKAVEIFNN